MHDRQPGIRLLARAWAIMMLLTVGTMIAGRVTSDVTLGVAWMVALSAITWGKSLFILRYYLNLRAAEGGWNKAFSSFLFVLLLLILLLFTLPLVS